MQPRSSFVVKFVLLLAVAAALSALSAAAAAARVALVAPNFVAVHWLRDGEHERWAHKSGVWVKETTVAGDKHRMRLWQGSDARRFLQAIFDSDSVLRDCEMLRDDDSVSSFLSSFDGVLERARVLAEARLDVERSPGPGWNETLRLVTPTAPDDDDEDGRNFDRMMDLARVTKECKELHRRIKKLARQHQQHGGSGGSGGSGEETSQTATTATTKDNSLARLKRELFIYPGTNWCGIGAATEKYNDLGLNAAADRCCRQHDYCAHIIEGFSTNYNLFNYRFHTLSHCDCDERFRTCLKMVNNGAANMVGRLFFNIVQMRCFILKSEKVCSKRSWWGKCLKYQGQKTAHLKDALPF